MALDYNDPTDRKYGNWSTMADVMRSNTNNSSTSADGNSRSTKKTVGKKTTMTPKEVK